MNERQNVDFPAPAGPVTKTAYRIIKTIFKYSYNIDMFAEEMLKSRWQSGVKKCVADVTHKIEVRLFKKQEPNHKLKMRKVLEIGRTQCNDEWI